MVMIYRLIFFALVVIFLWQVFWPTMTQKPIFPWFRSRKKIDAIKSLNEELELQELEARIEVLKQKAQKAKQKDTE